MLYNALIYPLLLYGITLWGLTFISNFDSLLAIQNKFLKIINFSNQYDSPHPLYSTSKILKVNDLHELQLASFVYESYMQQNPQEFHSYFTDVTKVHSYSTRQTNDKDLSFHKKIPHNMVYAQLVMPEHHFGTVFSLILGTILLSTAFVKA